MNNTQNYGYDPTSWQPEGDFQEGLAPQATPSPWFKKKRFIVPTALITLVGVGGAGYAIASMSDSVEKSAFVVEVSIPEPEEVTTESEETEEPETEQPEVEETVDEVTQDPKPEQKTEAPAGASAPEPVAQPSVEQAVVEPAPVTEPEPAQPEGSLGQQNALQSALSYLSWMSFSRSGLIEQLEFEGYSTADATWAVDRTGTNWTEQAVGSARSYLSYSSFSRKGLIEQLEFEGFSTADATYGVDSQNADWNAQAALTAQNYLSYSAFSRSGLYEQLLFEGFSPDQAEYGVTAVGY